MNNTVYIGSIQLKYCSICGSLLVDCNSHKHHKNGLQSYCVHCRKIYDDLIRKQIKILKDKNYTSLVEPYREFIFNSLKNDNVIKIEDVVQKCKNKCSLYFKNDAYILSIEKDIVDNFLNSIDEYFVIEVMSPIKGDYSVVGNFVYSRKEVESFSTYFNPSLSKYVADFNAEIKFDDFLRNTFKKEKTF